MDCSSQVEGLQAHPPEKTRVSLLGVLLCLDEVLLQPGQWLWSWVSLERSCRRNLLLCQTSRRTGGGMQVVHEAPPPCQPWPACGDLV